MKTFKKKKKERKTLAGWVLYSCRFLDPFSEASLFPANETMNYVAGTSLLLQHGKPFLLSFSGVINWNNFTLPEEQSFQGDDEWTHNSPYSYSKVARSPLELNEQVREPYRNRSTQICTENKTGSTDTYSTNILRRE